MKMKVWVIKKDFEFLKSMLNEARTGQIEISSFKKFEDDREMEIEIRDTKEITKEVTYTLSERFGTFAKGIDYLRSINKISFTMKENMKARLKDRTLFNSWLDSCTAIVYKANSDEFLIVPKCDLLLNIDKDFNKSSIILSDEEYENLKKQKGTVVLNRKEVKCDEYLTLEEVKEHPVWLALCEQDKKLLSDYAEYYFKEFGKEKAMKFWIQNKSGKNELRSVVLYSGNCYSFANGNYNLDYYSHFVSR
jgi:hypothetical protein